MDSCKHCASSIGGCDIFPTLVYEFSESKISPISLTVILFSQIFFFFFFFFLESLNCSCVWASRNSPVPISAARIEVDKLINNNLFDRTDYSVSR